MRNILILIIHPQKNKKWQFLSLLIIFASTLFLRKLDRTEENKKNDYNNNVVRRYFQEKNKLIKPDHWSTTLYAMFLFP